MKKISVLIFVSMILLLAFSSCTMLIPGLGDTVQGGHQHEYSQEWQTSSTTHFKGCECGVKADEADHADSDGNGTCDTCGFDMSLVPSQFTVTITADEGITLSETSIKAVAGSTVTFTASVASEYELTATGAELTGTEASGANTVYKYSIASLSANITVTVTKAEKATECQHQANLDAATCTENKVCELCEAVLEEAKGHTWVEASCTEAKHCSACDAAEGEALGHNWQDATCTSAKVCLTCDATEGEALGHDWQDATCQAPMTCSLCSITEGEPLEHIWQSATCTEPRTCSLCNETKGSALGHEKVGATCTSPITCKYCDYTEGEALGHAEVTDTGYAATCTDDGLTDGAHCSRCNEVLAEQTVIGALGHSYGELVEYKAAACEVNGNYEHYECSVCHGYFDAEKNELASVIIPALEHNVVVDKAVTPTCTESGITEGSHCSICDKVFTAQITLDALGHDYGDLVPASEAKCEADGNVAYYECSRCHKYFDENKEEIDNVVIPALTHNWDDGVETPSTCVVNGYTLYTCGHCGETKKENELPLADHTWNREAPTCTEDKRCEVCNKADGYATGHSYTIAPTCTTARKCANCDSTTGSALGHSLTTLTCTEDSVCTREGCGHIETEAPGHSYGDLIGEDPAACEKTGVIAHYTCSVCNKNFDADKQAVDTIIIPALEHSFGEWKVLSPTCINKGYTYRICELCQVKETKDETDPTGIHTYGDATCTVAQTCNVCGHENGDPAGHEYNLNAASCTEDKYCTVCKEIFEEATGHTMTERGCLDDICSVCGYVKEGTGLGHDYTSVVTAATCTTEGYTTNTCNREGCGTVTTTDITEALGHTGGTATCVDLAVCSRCEQSYGELDPDNHKTTDEVSWSSDETYHWMTCPSCNNSTGEIAHEYSPKSNGNGTHTYTCVCGVDNGVTSICSGGVQDCFNAPVCSTCNATYGSIRTHNIETTTIAATCLESGSTVEACTYYGCTYCITTEIPALGHDMPEDYTVVDPTCESGGYSIKECANGCGEKDIKDETEALGHNVIATDEIVAATCTTDGYTVYSCANGCGLSENRDAVAALGHTELSAANHFSAAACTREGCGYTEGEKLVYEATATGSILLTADNAAANQIATIQFTAPEDGNYEFTLGADVTIAKFFVNYKDVDKVSQELAAGEVFEISVRLVSSAEAETVIEIIADTAADVPTDNGTITGLTYANYANLSSWPESFEVKVTQSGVLKFTAIDSAGTSYTIYKYKIVESGGTLPTSASTYKEASGITVEAGKTYTIMLGFKSNSFKTAYEADNTLTANITFTLEPTE